MRWAARSCKMESRSERWKIVYPTHEEAAYPMLLCKRLADIAFQQAINLGAIFVDTLQEQIQTSDTTAHRFLINMLPRGKKFKPLVSEYGSYSLVAVKPQENLDHAKVLEYLSQKKQKLHIDGCSRGKCGSMKRPETNKTGHSR